jgi:hypothetical protein
MNSSVVCDVEDSEEPLPPPKPVVVGDMFYLYRLDPNYDRELDEIDWENLAIDDSEGFDPERDAYDSDNYATEEEAEAALEKLFEDCLKEARHEARTAAKDAETR